MTRFVFDSVSELISFGTLDALTESKVLDIAREPFEPEHFSGSTLERLQVDAIKGRVSFVVKHFHPQQDWVMRLTHDSQVREAMLYKEGVLARLPQECYSPILAVARENDSWATLMRDEAETLAAPTGLFDPAELAVWLEALAAMHARFWCDSSLQAPALGLSALADFVTILAPETVERELSAGRKHFILEAAARGWQVFYEIAPGEVKESIRRIQKQPQALLAELEKLPRTLIHGDFKASNLGVKISNGRPVTVLLDWQDATSGTPYLDLGYFLAVNGKRLSGTLDETIALYANTLAKRGLTIDPFARDLGLLVGGALRLFWQIALAAQATDAQVRAQAQTELEWWYELVRRLDSLHPKSPKIR